MMTHLKRAGISTGLHYPIPLHLQNAYSQLNYRRGDFPIAERTAAEILSLPIFPQLTSEQQSRVAEEALAFHSQTPTDDVGSCSDSLAVVELAAKQ
jgi:dTDP-4-amino-4,6-dideoxygalactose transaminase